MKNCAKKLNVDTATLLARITQQEEEHKRRLVASSSDSAMGITVPRTFVLTVDVGKKGKTGGQKRPLNKKPACVER